MADGVDGGCIMTTESTLLGSFLIALLIAASYIDSLAAKIRALEKESELLKSRLWNLEHQRMKDNFYPGNSPYGFTGSSVCNVTGTVNKK